MNNPQANSNSAAQVAQGCRVGNQTCNRLQRRLKRAQSARPRQVAFGAPHVRIQLQYTTTAKTKIEARPTRTKEDS